MRHPSPGRHGPEGMRATVCPRPATGRMSPECSSGFAGGGPRWQAAAVGEENNPHNLTFSQLARGIGEAREVVLFTTRDGREVVALASEWPRVDVFRRADGSLGAVTRTSPDAQKIAFYRSLFRGREDAYASGYLRKDGRMGYATFTTVEDSQPLGAFAAPLA